MAPTTDKPGYNKAADYDKDGKNSPQELRRYNKETLAPDPLSRAELAKQYGYALRIIESDPEILALFERAVNAKKGQWTRDRFIAELMDTQWWDDNNEYAREAIAAEAMGGADWNTKVETAQLAVQAMATNEGVDLSAEELRSLAEQTIAGGWDRPGREQLLRNALVSRIQTPGEGKFMEGRAGNLEQVWMQTAAANGLKLSRDFFSSAARSVGMGLSTAEDVERQIREQAASMYPTFSQQIMNGSNARDLASGYINMMAQELELDPELIDLGDPMIRQAMGGVDEKGQPKVEGLWDFQQRLRRDPRWMNTKSAADEISRTARVVLETFGMVG
jgi:hypothetical protein